MEHGEPLSAFLASPSYRVMIRLSARLSCNARHGRWPLQRLCFYALGPVMMEARIKVFADSRRCSFRSLYFDGGTVTRTEYTHSTSVRCVLLTPHPIASGAVDSKSDAPALSGAPLFFSDLMRDGSYLAVAGHPLVDLKPAAPQRLFGSSCEHLLADHIVNLGHGPALSLTQAGHADSYR